MINRFKPHQLAPLFLVVAACGQSWPAVDQVKAAEIHVGNPLPPPTDPVVLVVSGKVGTVNRAGEVAFDLTTLEKLGTWRYTVGDPWEEYRDKSYSGVLLRDLVEVLACEPGASDLLLTAADSYTTTIPFKTLDEIPIILVATRVNGERIPHAENGPLRIVFPYQHVDNERDVRNMSIWSLSRIEVR